MPLPPTPLILGLAGGIGSGKSAVARALADLGAMVTDSDSEAKAALDRAEVRTQLVSWWGNDILDSAGEIDRKRIADIIFKDTAQRKRLEDLIHPLLKRTRAELIAQAAASGVHTVVIDAPLLFEAGLEGECDFIIFVNAPREERLARVMRTRRWTEEEFNRREASQLPPDEKRRRSHVVIDNTGEEFGLRAKVAATLAQLRSRPRP